MTFNVNESDNLKIRDIIQKLKSLECPLIGQEDAWVAEIMFKPNFDRYHLMEWIFSKLEFNTAKKLVCLNEEKGFQNSSEVKVKNLLDVFSALGLCSKDRSDIIEGEAPLKEQLHFWKLLVDILWKKCSYSLSVDEATCSKGPQSISNRHYQQTKYIRKFCETVNLTHFFKDHLDLFPAFLLKESDDMINKPTEFPSLQRLQTEAVKIDSPANIEDLVKMDRFNESNSNNSCAEDATFCDEECLERLEENISSRLTDLKTHTVTDFNEAYQNLKLYLNVPKDESIDVGPSFQATNNDLNGFLKLNLALSTLKKSETELKTMNSDLQSFEVPSQTLPDSLLREYIAVVYEKK